MRKKKNKSSMLFKFIGVGLLVAVAIVYYFFFAGMSSSGDTQYV